MRLVGREGFEKGGNWESGRRWSKDEARTGEGQERGDHRSLTWPEVTFWSSSVLHSFRWVSKELTSADITDSKEGLPYLRRLPCTERISSLYPQEGMTPFLYPVTSGRECPPRAWTGVKCLCAPGSCSLASEMHIVSILNCRQQKPLGLFQEENVFIKWYFVPSHPPKSLGVAGEADSRLSFQEKCPSTVELVWRWNHHCNCWELNARNPSSQLNCMHCCF